MDKLNELSLCAGIAGISLGLRQTGKFRTICYSEIEANCVKILKGRIKEGLLDDAPIWGDLIKFNGRPWRGCVDIITGGFPCQPYSVAGSRLGEEDKRHLWPHILRIIREVEPKWLLLENVPGLLNISSGKTIRRIFGDISESGYDAVWFVKDSQYFGVPQRRRRLFIVGYPRGTSGSKILSVFESGIWDIALRREKRQETSRTTRSRSAGNKDISSTIFAAYGTKGMELQVFDNHSGTLKAGQGPPSVTVPVTYGKRIKTTGYQGDDIVGSGDCSPSLTAQGGNNGGPVGFLMQHQMTVRRLTPTECERLQGFPISWTECGINDKGNKIKMSDTARYKSLGNAVTVPVINWIGKRILECME